MVKKLAGAFIVEARVGVGREKIEVRIKRKNRR